MSQSKILYFINKQIFPLFIFFIILNFLSNTLPIDFFNDNRELQIAEFIQNAILIYILVLNFQFRKLYVRVSNLLTYLLRQFFILFILYEELSFFTFSGNNLSHNFQQEINLHNSRLMNFELFSLTIPSTNLTYNLTLGFVLFFSVLFVFGYGSYFPFFKKIRYFFLDKQFSIYTFMWFIHIVIYSIKYDFNLTYLPAANSEMIEIFFYGLILIDTLKKRRIFSEK